MKTTVVLLALLLSIPLISAQRVRAAGPHIADQASTQFEKSVPPPPAVQSYQIDPSELRQDAEELAGLAQSIPPAVDQTTKGLLPKDLDQKLKRIEKLAKQLRSKIYR
jgi:hypothetical protein